MYRQTGPIERNHLETFPGNCACLVSDDLSSCSGHLFKPPVSFQVASIHAQSSRLEVTNTHLTSDLAQCEKTKRQAAADVEKQQKQKQTIHDNQVGVQKGPPTPSHPLLD